MTNRLTRRRNLVIGGCIFAVLVLGVACTGMVRAAVCEVSISATGDGLLLGGSEWTWAASDGSLAGIPPPGPGQEVIRAAIPLWSFFPVRERSRQRDHSLQVKLSNSPRAGRWIHRGLVSLKNHYQLTPAGLLHPASPVVRADRTKTVQISPVLHIVNMPARPQHFSPILSITGRPGPSRRATWKPLIRSPWIWLRQATGTGLSSSGQDHCQASGQAGKPGTVTWSVKK